MSGDCQHVAEVGQFADEPYNRLLYVGVGNACLAAFEGEAHRWEAAERSFDLLAGMRDRTGCYGRTAYDLLEALVEAHREDPTREFERQDGAAGSGGCVLVQTVTPERGLVTGGYHVTLTGSNFPKQGLLTVIDVNLLEPPPVVPFQSTDGGTRITFRMPAVEEAGHAYLIVDGSDEYWNSAVDFVFEPATSPEEPTSDSEPEEPTPTAALTPETSPSPAPTSETSSTPAPTPVPTPTPSAS